MFQTLDTRKADKGDINFTKSLIETLNDRLKHLSVMQYELTNYLISGKNFFDSRKDEKSRVKFITEFDKIHR